MFTYACLRDTHSSSSQYLRHKDNNLCLDNKDTVTLLHTVAQPQKQCCDTHYINVALRRVMYGYI